MLKTCIPINIPEDLLVGMQLHSADAHQSLGFGLRLVSEWLVDANPRVQLSSSEALVLCCRTPSTAPSLKQDLTEGSSSLQIQVRIWLFQ